MSDEEKKSLESSSEGSTKCSSKRSNNDTFEQLPKRPRMNLWENQNKNTVVANKVDNITRLESDDSDSDKSSDFDIDDDTSLEELAATICGLPHSELYSDEIELFPWLTSQSESIRNVYMYIRNRACMVWLKDPKVQLTERTLCQSINSSSSDKYFQDIIAAKLCGHQKNEDNSGGSKNQSRLTSNADKAQLKKVDIDAILKDSVYKENVSKLATMAIAFLERCGFANIGVFNKQTDAFTNGNVCGNNASPLQVIVVGAGLAGIMAALQLQYFGCKVLVLEAKEGPGGRLQTFQKGPWLADISPFSITGINNPVNQLIKQAGLAVTFFNSEVDIVNVEGEPVSKEAISRVECELNRLMVAAHDICAKFSLQGSLDKRPVSLGEMLEALLSLQTMHCKNLKRSSNGLVLRLMGRLQEVITEMEQQKTIVAAAHKLWVEAEEEARQVRKRDNEVKEEPKEVASVEHAANSNSSPTVISMDLRGSGDTSNDEEDSNADPKADSRKTLVINPSQQMKVNLALSEYRRVFKKCVPFFEEAIKIRKMIKLIQEYDPASMLLDRQDVQLMDWFLGNLELRTGTKLDNLSLRHCGGGGGQEVMNLASSGGEIFIKKGFQALVDQLTKKNSAFQYNTVVREISYGSEGVDVTAINTALSEDEPVNYRGDVVICTLPLGVLKESINNPTGSNSPQFNPPLPDWKKASINALGFGISDKVVLCFKERFWGTSKTKLFAQLNANSANRGEFLQFYAFSNRGKTGAGGGSDEDSDVSEDSDEGRAVAATVVGVVCVQAALQLAAQQDLGDEALAQRALVALRALFLRRKVVVPDPETISVVRWSRDVYARGVSSYVPEGASPGDVSSVAACLPLQDPEPTPGPVPAAGQTSQKQRRNTAINHTVLPRLFFAGEHTHRAGVGTVQAAMSSGLRAAADVARLFFPQLPGALCRLHASLQVRK